MLDSYEVTETTGADALRIEKPFKLTAKQKEAVAMMSTDSIYFMAEGGSRSAKTFAIVRSIVTRAITVPHSRHAIFRFRFKHVKATIGLDTFPKVMRLCFPTCPHHLDKSDWYVKFPNGAEIWFGGLDDKERTEKILGSEYATIFVNEVSQCSYDSILTLVTRLAQKCMFKWGDTIKELRLKFYMDQNPPSKGHWTFKLFHKKIDPETKRPLPNPEDYPSILMNPRDNIENIPAAYIKQLQAMPKHKRERFWDGKYADTDENALWTVEMIEKNRVTDHPRLVRIVVGVDPSGADDKEESTNDEIGIFVAGLGVDGVGYALEDLTLKAGPAKWGGVAVSAFQRHRADRIVGEVNYGGAMVEFVIKTAAKVKGMTSVSYKSVHATRGKTVRAEPISALTEEGLIKFVGNFDDCEDELCSFNTTGYIGDGSPNRADAFIWCFTELFPGLTTIDHKPKDEDLMVPDMERI